MTDTALLNQLIKTSGIKKSAIAERLKITTFGLQKKSDNRSEFTASEIEDLCDVLNVRSLNMRDRIFFVKKDDFKSSEMGA